MTDCYNLKMEPIIICSESNTVKIKQTLCTEYFVYEMFV